MPGCGGFFMVKGFLISVVIDIINILSFAIETKGYTPVCANGYGPKPFQLSFERMQPESRQVHVIHRRCGVKHRQNIPELPNMFRHYAACVVVFEEPSQSLVTN
jgi:hypothetical protein